MKPNNNIPIPERFLSLMSTYSINNVHGDYIVTAKITNSPIPDMRNHISTVKNNIRIATFSVSTRSSVVGVDIKRIKDSKRTLLVFYAQTYHCLVYEFNGPQTTLPQELLDYLKNSDICFIGSPKLLNKEYENFFPSMQWHEFVVGVGELASRVLKKPALIESTLVEIARETGVPYDEPTCRGGVREIQVDSRNPSVFSEETMKSVISDAYAYYKIGCNLLTSLS